MVWKWNTRVLYGDDDGVHIKTVILGVRLCDGPELKLFILVGWDRSSFVCCLVNLSSTDDLYLP